MSPGPRVAVSEAAAFPAAPLYASNVVRTLFLQFEAADWESELSDFHGTDVDVPATLTVDGAVYRDVGVHFRGMSSFMMVPEGHKRSLNLSLDFAHRDQQWQGHRTLNLLNSHEDPTFLRTVLYCQVAREFIPAPQANFVRVVINGESWGVYVNSEQFNKEFLKEWYGTTKGARWKVSGSPRGQGGLAYLGDDRGRGRRFPGMRAPVQGVELDPLVAANDPDKALLSKLLAVPALRARYLGDMRDIAERWLDWKRLGPIAERYHELIRAEVEKDTRKLDSTEDFLRGLTNDIAGSGPGPGRGGTIGLKSFADQRRAYLLSRIQELSGQR